MTELTDNAGHANSNSEHRLTINVWKSISNDALLIILLLKSITTKWYGTSSDRRSYKHTLINLSQLYNRIRQKARHMIRGIHSLSADEYASWPEYMKSLVTPLDEAFAVTTTFKMLRLLEEILEARDYYKSASGGMSLDSEKKSMAIEESLIEDLQGNVEFYASTATRGGKRKREDAKVPAAKRRKMS